MELCECLHLGPLLARWHAAEWAHLYDSWDEDAARAEFASMTTPGVPPTTWVAFDGRGRDGADVLGSISLVPDDELDGFQHLGPWLASLYVTTSSRGRGVGTVLVEHLVTEARSMGYGRVHLFTAGQEPFYARLGWRTIARPRVHGNEAAVMVLDVEPGRAIP